MKQRFEQISSVLLLGLLFVVAWYQRELIVDAFHRVSLPRLFVVLGAMLPIYLTAAASWRQLLIGTGNRLSYKEVLAMWILSNIARYIPGTIWQFVGRVYFAEAHGVPRHQTALSIVYEIALLVVSATVVVLTTLPFWPIVVTLPWWVSLAGVAALALLWPSTLSSFVVWISRVRKQPIAQMPTMPGAQLAKAFGFTLLRFVAGGTAFWVLASVFLPLTVWDLPGAIGMYSLAWLIGYVTVFAPAGVGVADGSLAALLAPKVGIASSLSVVVVFRALLFLAEALIAGIALAFYPQVIGLVRASRRQSRLPSSLP